MYVLTTLSTQPYYVVTIVDAWSMLAGASFCALCVAFHMAWTVTDADTKQDSRRREIELSYYTDLA